MNILTKTTSKYKAIAALKGKSLPTEIKDLLLNLISKEKAYNLDNIQSIEDDLDILSICTLKH